MSLFKDYASYYDLLYRDKDYEAEGRFVDQLIKKLAPDCKTILELGCGTGRHAEVLAQLGYFLHGVDQSETMLSEAEARLLKLSPEYKDCLHFSPGDIRTVRLKKDFDLVLSLFHVMSYQASNDDLKAAFATARSHLKPGGLFIFDCWYGPAVLTDRPAVRIKRLTDEKTDIIRIAEPVMYPNDNCADINYEMQIVEKKSGKTSKLSEKHRMRYIFMPEISEYLSMNNMELVFSCEWMTERKPGFDTWNICCCGRVVNA